MVDFQTRVAIGREIMTYDHDMRTAMTRTLDAAKTITRELAAFDTPLGIDLIVIDAAMADLRAAQMAYADARRKKQDREAALLR